MGSSTINGGFDRKITELNSVSSIGRKPPFRNREFFPASHGADAYPEGQTAATDDNTGMIDNRQGRHEDQRALLFEKIMKKLYIGLNNRPYTW